MKFCAKFLALALLPGLEIGNAHAQVYSPKVLAKDQVDTSDLSAMAKSIYAGAGASTPRRKAEAIWRFFLTDGRFVPPGFWYHIAGWAYEEPQGEVLEPLRLINSYGFGLCYHIAPLLEAVFKAGGFEDARVWFLTGHTVTEVYYEGAYHHFDSDMMGYTTVGDGNPEELPVASVMQIARNGNIILSKLRSPTQVETSRVASPWYPADLRAAAMADLAGLFTSTKDNWLYAFTRYSQAHSMEFVLRPGERLIRYFQPESEGLYYLPFKYDGKVWTEFPAEVAQYNIRTEDGPRSQKDSRRWATGNIEYTPVLSDRTAYYPAAGVGMSSNLQIPEPGTSRKFLTRKKADVPAQVVFEMQSAYVLIDARVSLEASLQKPEQRLKAEISVDGGKTWEEMSRLEGPFQGQWQAQPVSMVHSKHGSLTAVSGKYQYLARLTFSGPGPADTIQLSNIQIASRFQVNPRTLPQLVPGINDLTYHPGPVLQRRIIPVKIAELPRYAFHSSSVQYIQENGQGVLWPDDGKSAEIVFELSAPDGAALSGFDAGARFLDLSDGLAPDKFTAETRKTGLGQRSSAAGSAPEASIEWSTSPSGGYSSLWEYSPQLQWRDAVPVGRVLRWPEVDRRVRSLPAGTRRIYLRYRLKGMGLDNPRMAVISSRSQTSSTLEIIHQWYSGGQMQNRVEHIENPALNKNYRIDTGAGRSIVNYALIFRCPSGERRR